MSILLNIEEITENKDNITQSLTRDKWCSMEYRTRLGDGRLAIASQFARPEPLVLLPKTCGWHKIHMGFFCMEFENNIHIKLSSDSEYTPISYMLRGAPDSWRRTEYMQEVFWKCADMTDEKIILAKPEWHMPSVSGISWIRLEPMTDEEVERYKKSLSKENKCVQLHIDPDPFFEDRSYEKSDLLARLSAFENSNADFCALEYSMLYEKSPESPHKIPFRQFEDDSEFGKFKNADGVFERYLEWSKRSGIPLYATERMSVATFHMPHARQMFISEYVLNNERYHIENRDGSKTAICSYAYDEVQAYVLERMVKMIAMGFDGISMIFHRGVELGFEKPCAERFARLYSDIDIHTVPVKDSRLHSVWCEIMTEFMRKVNGELSERFGRKIPINVICDYSLDTSRHFGIDIEAWAREGLITSASQADMEMYENLTDCMSDESPDLIDLEKYKKALENRQVLCRHYGTDVDKVCRFIGQYASLENRYGIKVYHVLPWINSIAPEDYTSAVERMKSSGAKRFLAWNTNHVASNRPELLLITSIGNDIGTDEPLRSFYRVLSLDNTDISQAVPNWRG